MAMPNLDPNFIKEQQQVMRMIGLKRAKKTVKTASPKKLLFILIPVFVIALAITLFSSEIFAKGYTVSWNGADYRLPHDLNAVMVKRAPEGYAAAGKLVPAEEDASANWFSEAKVYLKEGSDRVIYLFVDSPPHMVGFYRARKKWF